MKEKLRQWLLRCKALSPAVWGMLVLCAPLIVCSLVIGLLLYGSLAVAVFPFEYPRYRRSHFRNAFHARYVPLVTIQPAFRFYEVIAGNHLDVEFIREENGFAYLFKDGCVYLFDSFEDVNFEGGQCFAAITEGEYIPLEDALAQEAENVQSVFYRQTKCLMKRAMLSDKQHRQWAEEHPLLVLYDKPEDIAGNVSFFK